MTAVLQVRRRTGAPAIAAFLAALVLVALLAAAPPRAAAADPANLRDQLTDDVGALSAADERLVAAELARLLDASGVQLWVWFTDNTGGMEAPDFAAATAKRSSLGGTDVLLVLAMSDRAYGFSRPEAFRLSNAELEALLSERMEPSLRAGDNAAAIVETAKAIGEALAAPEPKPTVTPTEAATPGPTPRPADGGGGGGLGTGLMIVVIVGIIGVIGWLFFFRRRPGGAAGPGGATADPLAALSDGDLNAEANRLLLATDDAVRDSEQELGFAEAQFGEALAAPFRAAIAAARDDLKGAFTLRQQLDDGTPEDRPTRRRMLADIVGRCRAAQGRLDAEADRFEELRAFEREAPTVLAGLPAGADALEARLPGVETTMAELRQYADAAWQAVAPNLDEARTRLAAVRAAVTEGQAALARGDSPRVAAAARVGQDALGSGGEFLDAVERLARTLRDARDKLAAEIADAEADLARARGAAAAGPTDAAIAAQLAEADRLLAAAREEVGHPKPDVAAGYASARRANEIADAVMAGIRTAAEQRAAMQARLDTSIRTAQATLTRAADYVANHRRGVREEARTRLAEAERHLDQAVAAGPADAAAGIREAEEAARLANQALSLAQRDYDGSDDPWRGGRGGGGRGGGGGGADIAGAIIGGIIGGMLSGGGGGGRGGGGGFGGFPGGGGGFGGGGIGGGWGGGGGGGGRSSGGGRW